MSILRQVTLQRANRRADKSIGYFFITSLEETTEQFMEVDRLVNTSGVIYYSEKGTLTQQEKDEIDKVEIEVEGKTKGQRLRHALYVLAKQKGKDFNQFYASRMEQTIQDVKDEME
jgi:hypothetical protein